MSLPANTLRQFPAPPVSQRVHFYDQFRVIRPSSGLQHGGVDLGGPRGTPIVAATAGQIPHWCVIGGERVKGVGFRSTSSGHYCVIVDEQGYFYYYFHMLKMATLRPGDHVYAGRRIGAMSNTGRAGRVHLHFQALNHVHNRAGSEQWYRELVFPEANLSNLNPFRELRRVAEASFTGVRRGHDANNGLATVDIPIQRQP